MQLGFTALGAAGGQMQSLRRIVFALLTAGGLSACATDAQRRAQHIMLAARTIVLEAKRCMDAVNADPRYTPLWVHIPKGTASPSIEQLAESAYATSDDIILEDAHHDALLPCRDEALAKLPSIDSRFAAIFADAYNDSDSIVLSLVQRKITWGEANKQTQQLKVKTAATLQGAARQIDSELEDENAAELAHRAQLAQAITQAIGEAAQAAVIAAQAAQAARPVVTTCSGGANYATCVSHQ